MTPKDERDLKAALSWGADWIALSFVQTADDVAAIKARVAGRAAIMAKIEKPLALEQIEAIVAVADGVMVARGDLGVELPPEAVPAAQKRIVSVARRAGIPVVVATQMLESMIENPVPTRAEVSDVATAIYDGVDAIMLSAETATGAHPALAVEMMSKVASSVNADPEYAERVHFTKTAAGRSVSDAISAAAAVIIETVGARAIVCFTTSGSTALRLSRERPSKAIIVLTPSITCARRMSLVWGCSAVVTPEPQSFESIVAESTAVCLRAGIAREGDLIAVTAGVPFGTVGSTNVVHVTRVGDKPERFT
jgi:pyruvate kinase